jgi:hypothetical protein
LNVAPRLLQLQITCAAKVVRDVLEKMEAAKKSVAYAFPASELRASMPTSRKNNCCTTQCSALLRSLAERLSFFE